MDITETNTIFRHRLSVQTRFNDYDILGHLNNTVYLELADLGKTDYFPTAAPKLWNAGNVGMVVANVNADFHAPALPGEPLDVLTAVESIGNKSFILSQRIVCPAKNDQLKCSVRTIMVHIDVRSMHPAPVPECWISTLEDYESRRLRD